MTKRQLLLPAFLLSLCILAWSACTQQRQPCLTPKIPALVIETMHLPTDTATIFSDTSLQAAVFIPVTARSDSFRFGVGSFFGLTLSPDTTFCQWLFTTDTSTNPSGYDTLSLYYERKLQFLSNACGYTYFYLVDSVRATHNFVDSVHIINASVTNNANAKENLQVYIHRGF